jgi:hypothetical protein
MAPGVEAAGSVLESTKIPEGLAVAVWPSPHPLRESIRRNPVRKYNEECEGAIRIGDTEKVMNSPNRKKHTRRKYPE